MSQMSIDADEMHHFYLSAHRCSIYQNDRLDEQIPNLAFVLSYNEPYACHKRFYT